MKRKASSLTEEVFDSFMANSQCKVVKEIEETAKKPCKETKHHEVNLSDKDSDYGGSEYDTGEATTFKMLFEKTQVCDIEFVECCQQAGLIAQSSICTKCREEMSLFGNQTSYDGAVWKCPRCFTSKEIRENTWLQDIRQIRLKDVVLILYCWSRNYPEQLCQHEMDLAELSLVPFLYKKCQKLSTEYFNNEISNIGGAGQVVEIEQFQTSSGLHIIGGVERLNMKKVFFRVLSETWTRDDLITALADNISTGSVLHCLNQTLLDIIGPIGFKYLDKVWSLKVDRSTDLDSPIVPSLWALFERLIQEKDYTQNNLVEFLFRRRMESNRDPFLFLLSTISSLHPPS